MTTIPTIDNITGNTVMQKFRSLAKLVLDFMTPLYESTEEVIALKPELEQALADVLEQKALVENLRQIVINNVQTVNSLMAEVNTLLQSAVTIDDVQTITGQKTFSGNTIFTALTAFQNDVQITNEHSLSVAGDIDCANNIEADNLIARVQAEIAGMAIEISSLKTVLSNDNGISFPSPVSMANLDAIVPTTTTGTRDTKAANGSRIQNDLDAYLFMLRTTGDQTITGIKTFNGEINGGAFGLRINTNSIYSATSGKWKKAFNINYIGNNGIIINIISGLNNTNNSVGRFWINFYGERLFRVYRLYSYGSSAANILDVACSLENDILTVWIKTVAYNNVYVYLDTTLSYGSRVKNNVFTFSLPEDTETYDTPTNATTSIQMVSL